ncbi:MAG TPA: glycosyltransferase family 2 protein [Pirellulales bacterium]|nr:glycosyltransferase family 2 protein [Pirellulales bacterium]
MAGLAAASPPDIARSSAAVCAVVVTYQPEQALLEALLASIRTQVARVAVVDNASRAAWLAAVCREYGAQYVQQPCNTGLAAAQNVGIALARDSGSSHVLLLDQDSEPAPDMVERLLRQEAELLARGEPVAAVGPQFADRRSGRAWAFQQIGWGGIRRIDGPRGNRDSPVTAATFLIASGSLIAMPVFERVGVMREDLFIDNIDVEWCYRAAAQGLRCYGVFAARMYHAIGARSVTMFAGLRRQAIHSPQRLYYMTRNRVYLYRLPYVSRTWLLNDLPRLAAKLLLFSLFMPPRGKNLRAMLAGLCDGLTGRLGRRDVYIDA